VHSEASPSQRPLSRPPGILGLGRVSSRPYQYLAGSHFLLDLGQYVQLYLVTLRPISWEQLLETLEAAGLSLSSRNDDIIAWLVWQSSRGSIRLSANVHHGSLDRYFVELGFDSNVFASMRAPDERTQVLQDFVGIGKSLWRAHEFHEGEISPEEQGPLLSFAESEGMEGIKKWLPVDNYARFLSPSLTRLGELHDWLLEVYPTAEVVPLPRNGLLVTWDPSTTGTSRFLSLF